MKWHDDINKAFEPLSKRVRKAGASFDETMSQYMYMGHEEDHYYYKHFGDRSYVELDSNGHYIRGKLNDWREW